ncbi:MAG: glycosyltransferase [Actinobacteria bacterium]|nr:glycosyltransferase [Actinomycetota bacterium]
MKIVVFGPTHPIRGGISHYSTLMVENLRKRHEVLFISYLKQYPEFLYPGKTQSDDSDFCITTDNDPVLSFADPLSWRRAARKAAEFEPDLAVFSWVSPALAVQFRYISSYIKKNSPSTYITYVCHNVVQHEKRGPDVTLTRLAFRHCDGFVVHGKQLEDELSQIKPEAEVSVTPHPTYEKFAQVQTSRQKARELLGIDSDCPVALYFGFVRPYKGLMHLIKAMPAALRDIPDLHLLIAGEFWENKKEYESEIRNSGVEDRITVIDRYIPNEEIPLFFEAADVVVLPYVSASASGIIQIAYGFNKPVITTEVGTLPEVVVHGETGYVVPPSNHEALASAISEFFLNGASRAFNSNISEFKSRFSWDYFTEVIEEMPANV